MAFYSYVFTANYKRFFENLKKISRTEHRSVAGMALDTVWCVFRYGLGLTDYLNYEIYKRSAAQRREYVGARMENTYYEQVSPSAYKKRYTVKPDFLEDFKAYTKRDFIVPERCDFAAFNAFLDRHDSFMTKPYDGLGGEEVRKRRTAEITDRRAFYEDCAARRIFLEELVTQHPEMDRLCAKSVNTMRIMTFNDHGRPRILWMCLRVGNGVNDIDNFHAKGMAANIDQETGRLVGDAVDKDLNRFTVHPATGVPFDGFQIPCFEETKELVLRGALESDKILVVGWDVAVSDQGPVIIEGNRRPGFDLVQVLSGRGRMDIVRETLAAIGKTP